MQGYDELLKRDPTWGRRVNVVGASLRDTRRTTLRRIAGRAQSGEKGLFSSGGGGARERMKEPSLSRHGGVGRGGMARSSRTQSRMMRWEKCHAADNCLGRKII